jgi:hypothetical protein
LFLLPGRCPRREVDEGAAAAATTTFFPLPFGRPGLRFSGTPSPPAPGPPTADMVGLHPSKVEGKEEMECTFDPERPRHLKKSEAGERARVVGSVMPNASATAPLISRHARPREGNHRSHHKGSWIWNRRDALLTGAARRFEKRNHYGRRKSQAMAGDGTLRCDAQASSSVGPDSERFKFRGARRRLAAAEQPRAGLVLEPVCPETAGILQGLASRMTTSKPDQRS